jgi:hypothetical protein
MTNARERAAKFGYKVDEWSRGRVRPQTPEQRAGLAVFTGAAELDVKAAAEATAAAHVALSDAIKGVIADDVARYEAAQAAYNEARMAEVAAPIRFSELKGSSPSSRARRR